MKTLRNTLIFLATLFLLAWLGFGWDSIDRAIPLLPPVIAIGLAFITKNVLVSLFFGIWVGALATMETVGLTSFLNNLFGATLKVGDEYLVKALADSDHATIVLFTLTIGGVIGVVARSGGLHGVVEKLLPYCRTAGRTQIVTSLVGIFIFFDDYASTLVTGNTMRPLSDKRRISREKFSFIIDATAAPIASLVVISTWIGYEVSLIAEALKVANIQVSAYALFLDSLPHRFYALLILFFIFASAIMRRDFGSMLTAERRARSTGATLRPGSTPMVSDEMLTIELPQDRPRRWINAVLPLAVLVFTVLAGLWWTGHQALTDAGATTFALRDILSEANSIAVLFWGAIFATITAFLLILAQRMMTLDELAHAWIEGVKSMVVAMIILTMAWGLSAVIKELDTAKTLTDLTLSLLSPTLFPAIVFVLSAVVSFATGTSWGTMAILFPLLIPLLAELGAAQGMPLDAVMPILTATVGAVLTGAIFGDHCSPISDTTIMSSTFGAVDHLDHVRTQLGYALPVGIIALLTGYLPAGFGVSPYISLLVGAIAVWALLYIFGKDPDKEL